jgi:hypothetical protein
MTVTLIRETYPDPSGDTVHARARPEITCVVNMSVLQHDRTSVKARVPLPLAVWFGYALAAILSLDVLDLRVWTVVVIAAAAVLAAAPRLRPAPISAVDREDLVAVAVLYAGVVAAFYAAFRVFTVDNVLGLFLCFAAGLLLGVVGPVSTRCGSGDGIWARSASAPTSGAPPW